MAVGETDSAAAPPPSVAAHAQEAPSERAAGFSVRSSLFEHPRPSTAPPPARRSGFWSTSAMVAAFAAIGYFGWQAVVLDRRPAAPPDDEPSAAGAPGVDPEPRQGAAGRGGAQADDLPAPARPAPAPSMGRVLPFIDRSRGVDVAADEGLLLVEFEGARDAPKLRIGKRELGSAPLAVALKGGRHELVIERGEETSFRFLTIRPGETRIIDL
jgi:hypothetical protein